VTDSINGAPVVNYRKYIANISQAGTSDPTVTILENTIGDIVWTRLSNGAYIGTLMGAFPDATKVYALINQLPLGLFLSQIGWLSVNEIVIYTLDTTGAYVDFILDNTTIEIRVYE
jgi:hypothetical protein